MHTIYVYHESFEVEKFRGFALFRMSAQLFNMKVQDGAVESMRDSLKVFSQTCNRILVKGCNVISYGNMVFGSKEK